MVLITDDLSLRKKKAHHAMFFVEMESENCIPTDIVLNNCNHRIATFFKGVCRGTISLLYLDL